MTEEARKLADKCEAWPNVNLQPEENRLIVAAPASQDATRVLTEDQLTILVTKARGKFVNLGQETLDGCSMERFIARELLASPARADDGEKAAFLNKFCQSNGEEA